MAKNSMEILISVIDQASGPLKGIMAGVEDMQGAGKRLKEVGMAAGMVGAGMVGLAAPVLAVGAGAIRTAGDFEASMNRVAAITGATGENFDNLRELAKDLGATTQFSASQAAEAQQYLGMAGFSTNQIMEALPHTLNLAAAGALDLGRAADISSNILSGMRLEVSQLPHMNNVLAQTARSANVDIEMLGETFKYVAPVAAASGQSLELMSAAAGILGNAGIQGSQAGTALRMSILRLVRPPRLAQKALDELGLTTMNADGTMRGFDDIIVDLAGNAGMKALSESALDANGQLRDFDTIMAEAGEGGATLAQISRIFGTEATPAILALMASLSNEDPKANLLGLTEQLENTGDIANEMADIQMQGLNGGILLLKSAAEGLAIAIGDTGLLDWADSAVRGIADFLSFLTEINPAVLTFGVVVAGVGAALLAIGGTILIVAGGLAAAVGTLITTFAAGGALAFMTPMLTGAATALASFATGLATVVGLAAGLMAIPFAIFQIGAAAQGTTFTLQEFFNVIRTSIAQVPALLAQIPAAFRGAFMAAVNIARMSFAQMVAAITSGAAQMVGAIRSAGSQMVAAITGLAGAFRAAGANIISSLVQGIQSKIGEAQAAIASVASTIRGALPFSPPKWGPLSDIMSAGGNIVQSIASGISPAPIASAMSRALTPTQGQLASPTGGGGGGSVSVNFAPVINAGAGTDVGAIRQMLEEQIEQMIRQIQRNQERVRYG